MGAGASSSKAYAAKKKQIHEGETVPDVILKIRILDTDKPEEERKSSWKWRDVNSLDLFKNRRVVIFGVPGAFTPVCSCDHLPGYESLYDEIKKCDVDDIYCFSVNDAFVMRHWGIVQGLEETVRDDKHPLNPGNFSRVKLVPDGAAKFSGAMGLTCHWEKKGGFGLRSWRYSAVVKDGVVEKLFLEVEGQIEDDSPAGPEPLLVSDAQTMLTYLQERKNALSLSKADLVSGGAVTIATTPVAAAPETNQ